MSKTTLPFLMSLCVLQDHGIISLMIKEVSPRDEGVYKCRAENSEGYATTTAFLVVRRE